MVIFERTHLGYPQSPGRKAILLDDQEMLTAFFTQAVNRTKTLGSRRWCKEAITICWQARQHWPHTECIKDLAELFLQ